MDSLGWVLWKLVFAQVFSARPKHALAAAVGQHVGMGWVGMRQGSSVRTLCIPAEKSQDKMNLSRKTKSLPEGGKKSLGWHRCCLMPDGCWGSGKGLPAAALLGFAPQQVPVGDTGLEVALRNKWQKTRACLPANSIHLLGPLVFPKQPHHVLKSMCF